MNEISEEGSVRVFCKRCNKWLEKKVTLSKLAAPKQGVYSVAFQHNDHVLTVYIDKQFRVRGESVADILEDSEEDEKAVSFFDKL